MSRRSGREGRQQRQDDSNQGKYEAPHQYTIDGRLPGGDSNPSAQSGATASVACETSAIEKKRRIVAQCGDCRVGKAAGREAFGGVPTNQREDVNQREAVRLKKVGTAPSAPLPTLRIRTYLL
jgi:hypothetical protein